MLKEKNRGKNCRCNQTTCNTKRERWHPSYFARSGKYAIGIDGRRIASIAYKK